MNEEDMDLTYLCYYVLGCGKLILFSNFGFVNETDVFLRLFTEESNFNFG